MSSYYSSFFEWNLKVLEHLSNFLRFNEIIILGVFSKKLVKKLSLFLVFPPWITISSMIFENEDFFEKTCFESFAALEWVFCGKKRVFLKVSALEWAFLTSQILKILGVSKGFLTDFGCFECFENPSNSKNPRVE